MSQRALDRARTLFGSKIVTTHAFHGDETIVIDGADVHAVLETLRADGEAALDFLVDLTAVDWYGSAEDRPRFEVVYHLRSMQSGDRLRVKAQVMMPEDGTEPFIDSVVDLWKSANWMEREVFDMFGIKFRGHPDLRRILMYEEFIGYPLRKDYPKEKRQPLVRRDPNT
jgi:NADH-quinone oxidoreductase subunit C